MLQNLFYLPTSHLVDRIFGKGMRDTKNVEIIFGCFLEITVLPKPVIKEFSKISKPPPVKGVKGVALIIPQSGKRICARKKVCSIQQLSFF